MIKKTGGGGKNTGILDTQKKQGGPPAKRVADLNYKDLPKKKKGNATS